MRYECIGVTGFAGDRTPEAMAECHPFARAFAKFLSAPVSLHGVEEAARDPQWNDALQQSELVFSTIAKMVESSVAENNIPILVTPRCASAIASLPIIVSKFPDVVVLYFDAHGDLNTPQTSASGYLGGMPISAAMGEWDIGYGSGLPAQNLVHIGGRDLDDAEHNIIRDKNIMTLSKKQIESSLEGLAKMIRGRPVFIHIDTDVFDSSEVVAEYSVKDGLYRQHVDKIVSLVRAERTLIGLEITELSPKNDFQRTYSYKALLDSLNSLVIPPV